ncbi:MAG: VTT domain-containing protein [Clostridiales bacterium]|nr:VTT domain-containing protein [Clostridiales bacterium]
MSTKGKEKQTSKGKDYQKLVKVLQILSGVFMLAMMVVCIIFIKMQNISLKNVDELSKRLMESLGGAFQIGCVLILFSVIKSFALVFPPAVLYALSGVVFKGHYGQAVLVNLIATVLSLSLPYFLGKFTGKPMIDSLKGKFSSIKKIDDFAEANDFVLVFIIKASGLLPSDLSSVIFGSLNIPYWKYMIAANIGMLPLNLLWALLGAKGDLKNPLSYLYVLPILIFAIVSSVIIKKYSNKKGAANEKSTNEEEKES